MNSRCFFVVLLISISCNVFAQPVINSFSPLSGPAGTTVTIHGSGFDEDLNKNVVFFGAVKATVLTASVNSLTVNVPAGSTFQPISVTRDYKTAYSVLAFNMTFPYCPDFTWKSYTSPLTQITESEPLTILLSDLDGDSRPDLVSANQYSSTVSVFKNISSPGIVAYDQKIDYATGYYPMSLTSGDFNGDCKPDLVVTNSLSNSISVYKNTSSIGAISFNSKLDYTTTQTPYGVAVGDIDGDGKPDIVVSNYQASSISLFKNISDTDNISFAAKIDFPSGGNPFGVSISDLNNDGKPDIVLVNYYTRSLSLYKNTSNQGSISFMPRIDIPTTGRASRLFVADIDHDNKPDLLVTNSDSASFSVFRNSSTASDIVFDTQINFPAGEQPSYITANDLDGDGKPDVIINNYMAGACYIRNTSSQGIISFETYKQYDIGRSQCHASGDADLDGKPDFFISSGNNNSTGIRVFKKYESTKIYLVDSSNINNAAATGLCSVNAGDWANACGLLQAALDSAVEGDEVWVAKGNYFPSRDITNNENPVDNAAKTFVLPNGVGIYGGFNGTETSKADRSAAVLSILNGNTNDGGIINVYNVITCNGLSDKTILDQFRVIGGHSDNAHSGGGIFMNSSSPVISNCVFTGNAAEGAGGAMYNSNSSPIIVNCLFYNNSAQYGGAIANDHSKPVMINCTVTKNEVNSGGGAIYNMTAGAPRISNSIIWGNTTRVGLMDNIVSVDSVPLVLKSIIEQARGVIAGSGNYNANPLFVDFAGNDFRLLNGSIALNTGDSVLYPVNAPLVDVAGMPRKQNMFIDMGAFEGGNAAVINTEGILFVDSTSGSKFGNGSSWGKAYHQLSDALTVINNANVPLKQVWIGKGTYHPLYDSSGKPWPSNYLGKNTFAVKKGIKIYGGFNGSEISISQRMPSDNLTILNGSFDDYNYVNSVMYFRSIDTIVLDGLTVMNGSGATGGGLYVNSSPCIINNCKFIKNGASDGGAIYNFRSYFSISNCLFSDNRSGYGGAIDNFFSSGSIDNCLFTNNNPGSRNYSVGGAIYNFTSSPTINNCNFIDNIAVSSGGAIYNTYASAPRVKNCKFIGNRMSYLGGAGAVYNEFSSNAVFINCLFTKNYAQQGAVFQNRESTLTLYNCTLTNNWGYYGGGIVNHATYPENMGKAHIFNSIIWGNLSVYDRRMDNLFNYTTNTVADSFTVKYSLVGQPSGVFPGIGNINANPRFVDTAAANLALQYNSPAINIGNNDYYAANLTTDKDIAGYPRLSEDKIDLGAFEAGATICPSGELSFKVDEPGLMYQWQQDSGSGFSNIIDNSFFSGSTTDSLHITNAPTSWNGYKYRCRVDLQYSPIYTLRFSNFWKGTVDTTWENPANWSCQTVPDANTDVVIDNGTVVLSSNVIVRYIYISPSANFTITPGFNMQVNH